jgi:hypothetical protein
MVAGLFLVKENIPSAARRPQERVGPVPGGDGKKRNASKKIPEEAARSC